MERLLRAMCAWAWSAGVETWSGYDCGGSVRPIGVLYVRASFEVTEAVGSRIGQAGVRAGKELLLDTVQLGRVFVFSSTTPAPTSTSCLIGGSR